MQKTFFLIKKVPKIPKVPSSAFFTHRQSLLQLEKSYSGKEGDVKIRICHPTNKLGPPYIFIAFLGHNEHSTTNVNEGRRDEASTV